MIEVSREVASMVSNLEWPIVAQMDPGWTQVRNKLVAQIHLSMARAVMGLAKSEALNERIPSVQLILSASSLP